MDNNIINQKIIRVLDSIYLRIKTIIMSKFMTTENDSEISEINNYISFEYY